MKKFEYKFDVESASVADGGADCVEEWLNLLGREGWELIAVNPCGKSNFHLGYWFKRAVA
jgi:hypothetical protein